MRKVQKPANAMFEGVSKMGSDKNTPDPFHFSLFLENQYILLQLEDIAKP